MKGPRLPFAPLEELARHGRPLHVNRECRWCDGNANGNCFSLKHLARDLKVDPRQIYTWRRAGVDQSQADRLALAVGYMPWEVWSDWEVPVFDDEEVAA